MDKKPKDYNPKAPGVRRILREAFELRESTYQYFAQPLEENIYEWHFTIRGPDETEFQGGFYHGRILLPNDYPMKPPNFIFLTPNGRFDVDRKICLNISGFHPESWQPCWSIRTVLLAIISFLPVPYDGSVGSINYPVEERKKLAKLSRKFTCDTCHCSKITDLLKSEPVNDEAHNSQWYKDFQVYIQNLTSEHSNTSQPQAEPPQQPTPSDTTDPPVRESPEPAIAQNNETAKPVSEPIRAEAPEQTATKTETQSVNNIQSTVQSTNLITNSQSSPSSVHSNLLCSGPLMDHLRGQTGEIILYLCFGLTFAIIMRRFILSFYGIED